MTTLKIETAGGRTAFEPGEQVEVSVEWQLDDRPSSVELRLVWYTRGKGDCDWGLAESVPFEGAQMYDSRRCTLRLPSSPYSFSGKLISLVWALKLVVEPGEESHRLDVTIAPNREEVLLHRETPQR